MRALMGFVMFLPAALLADPANLGTFAATGSGSFNCDPSDAVAGYSVFFTGSNATYAIEVQASSLGGGYGFTSHLTFPCFGSSVGESTVIADNLPPSYYVAEPTFFSVSPAPSSGFNSINPVTFELGNGTGYLDVYDDASGQPGNPATLIATATLTGYVTITSAEVSGPPPYETAQGTFTVTSGPAPGGTEAPEPATALWLAVATAVYSARLRTRSRSDMPASGSSPSSRN
jgi:hypothetical protein